MISELINKTNGFSLNFKKIYQSLNMIFMKYYYTLLTKNCLLKNLGSYILLFNSEQRTKKEKKVKKKKKLN